MAEDKKESKDNPSFEIRIEGSPMKRAHNVRSIAVHREVNRISSARITIADGDPSKGEFQVSDANDFDPGTKIEIKAGYKGKNKRIFQGVIVNHRIRSKARGGAVLLLDCKDPAYQMTLTHNSDFFYDVTDSDLIQKLAKKYGLDAQTETTKVTHKEMVQYDATDWEFSVCRAERNGMYLLTEDGVLVLKAPDLSGEPSFQFRYGDNIAEIDTMVESRGQFPAVSTEAWDFSNQSLESLSAKKPDFKDPGILSTSVLAGLAKKNEVTLAHPGKISARELQSWADARIQHATLSKMYGVVKMVSGEARVKPGETIEFVKLGKKYNGKAFVSGVQHLISEKDWETHVQFGYTQDWSGKPDRSQTMNGLVPDIHGLHIGVVHQVGGDPEGEDRILVKIPAIDSQKDGVWARVSAIDAGKNRGAFFRPELGDEVILGFLANDPRHAIVLGMVNSSKLPAPVSASDENPEKGFISRDGVKLLFNDQDKSLTIETPNGNTLSLSDKDGGIQLMDENSNSIKLSKDGISIESSKDLLFKSKGKIAIEGADVTVKAEKNFKCSGSTGAELSSDASAVIKGSLVEIN